jgi:uncharacterized cupin superfamily protein
MSEIIVVHQPSKDQLAALDVRNWPIWEKEESIFPWTYDSTEVCLFLEGDVVVTPDGGAPITMGKGDLVTFPEGMSCTWEIRKAVRKHYNFE